MDDAALHRHLQEAGRRYLAALPQADPDAPVPTCPGWDVQRLTDHLGRVHRNVTQVLRQREAGPLPHAPTGPAITEWLRAGFEELTETLAHEVPPQRADEPIATTWAGVQPRRFWLRRMAHETTIHAWDLGHAVASPTPIDRALALDGIDELFEVFIPHRLDRDRAGVLTGTSLHLHATDNAPTNAGSGREDEGEWLLRADGDGVHWTHGHGKGDAAVRAPAQDLLLWAWGRLPDGRAEVLGANEVATRWQQALRF